MFKKIISIFGLLVLCGSALSFFTTTSVQANGGLNLDVYCSKNFFNLYAGGGFSRAKALNWSDVYSWRCEQFYNFGWVFRSGGIDMNLACRQQHGNQYRATFSNRNNAGSWYCY
jgi:hypothetical protein